MRRTPWLALDLTLTRITVLALSTAVVASGCTTPSADLSLVVRFVPPNLAQDVAAVEVFVLDRCAPGETNALDPAGDRIRGQQVLRYGETHTPQFPTLSSPTFAIYVRARDSSCRVVAAGCADFNLSADPSRDLVVSATPFTGSACAVRATCSNGACVTDLDAGGPDGGGADGSPDEGFDARSDALLDGSPDVTPAGDVASDACAAGLVSCPGGCADVRSDLRNCGACGRVCPSGEACMSGTCGACPPLERVCAGACVRLETDANHCGACGVSCGPARGCCASACTNLDGDEMHCGSCTTRCLTGERCCGGRCVNPDAAPSHCGACFVRCSSPQMCVMGMCR